VQVPELVSPKTISNFLIYWARYHEVVDRYTIHQIPVEETLPVSKSASRKLEHPAGSFAAYHPDPLLTPGLATLPHWDNAARTAEAAIKEFEQQHGDSGAVLRRNRHQQGQYNSQQNEQ